MRNFKKVLSLVLCMAMMLSVMVVGAGAAFKDQNKIVNTEAVDMCEALNIINGYTDGTFRPDGTITRAEACKMICVALNGGKEPVLGTSASATFTDTKGHWAEQYVEYCVSLGIVAGIGGGKFAPNATVTGSQFAKMLLIAMGYSADTENFTGAAWEVNVNVRASQKALYEDLETMDPSVALTRDNAAQMVWNALNAVMVKYDYKLSTVNGTLSSEMVVEDVTTYPTTMLEKNYKATNTYGQLVDITDNDKDEYVYTVKTSDGDVYFTTDADYSDLFAMNVKVITNNGDKKDVYGIVADDSAVIVEGIVGDIDDLDKLDNTTDEVTVNDVDYDVDKGAVKGAYLFCGDCVSFNKVATTYTGYKAFTFKAIDNNDNGKIDTVVVFPFTVEKVTFVNNTKFTTDKTFTTAEELEDVTYYDGMEKDDYVIVTAAANTMDNTAVLAKADVVTGKIDGKKTDKGIDSVRVDGTWYEEVAASVISQNNGATVEMVVVNGYVFHCETSSSSVAATDIVYLEDVAIETTTSGLNKGEKLMGKIVNAEGKIVEAEISAIDDYEVIVTDNLAGKTDKVAIVNDDSLTWQKDQTGTNCMKVGVNDLANALYSFEMDGDKYELTRINDSDKAGYDKYDASATGYDKDDATLGGYDIADDAVIFVKAADEDDTQVYTGAQLKTWGDKDFTTGKVLTLEQNSKFQNVAVAALTVGVLPTADDTQYGYVVADPYTTKVDGTTYYNYTVFVNGEEKDLISEDSVAKGAMIAFTTVEGNEIEIDDTFAMTNAAVLAATDSRVQLKDASGIDTYKITAKTVIVYIDTEDVIGSEGGSIATASDANKDNYKANVAYKLTDDASDKEIEVIYVATNGEIADGATIAH